MAGGLTDEDEDAVLEEYERMFGETEDIKLPDAPSEPLPELGELFEFWDSCPSSALYVVSTYFYQHGSRRGQPWQP